MNIDWFQLWQTTAADMGFDTRRILPVPMEIGLIAEEDIEWLSESAPSVFWVKRNELAAYQLNHQQLTS